jgi:hypothetical protein
MQSAWEKMTAGQCNNSTPEVKRKSMTARQLKDNYARMLNNVERKFDRIAALDAQGTQESRKEYRRMSDSWTKRVSTNTKGFFDRAAARAAKRAVA